MIIDIYNEVFTNLKNNINNANVLPSFPMEPVAMPCVTIEETSNVSRVESRDTDGEQHNEISFEINIFTNGNNKVSEAKALRNSVDAIMSDVYNMNRLFSDTVPNFADGSVYRYTMRYDFSIDKNKKIYRR